MPTALHDHPLELHKLLPDLVEQGLVTADMAQRLATEPSTQHPLEYIAALGPCLERLTQWLAGHVGQPYLRIDPLNIDVATVVPLMSHGFAQRHAILAVAVDAQTVTVASAQPYVCGWEAGLAQVLKRSIKRVVANPKDIQRCIDEFYRLTDVVLTGSKGGDGGTAVQSSTSGGAGGMGGSKSGGGGTGGGCSSLGGRAVGRGFGRYGPRCNDR